MKDYSTLNIAPPYIYVHNCVIKQKKIVEIVFTNKSHNHWVITVVCEKQKTI